MPGSLLPFLDILRPPVIRDPIVSMKRGYPDRYRYLLFYLFSDIILRLLVIRGPIVTIERGYPDKARPSSTSSTTHLVGMHRQTSLAVQLLDIVGLDQLVHSTFVPLAAVPDDVVERA